MNAELGRFGVCFFFLGGVNFIVVDLSKEKRDNKTISKKCGTVEPLANMGFQ